MSKNPASSNDSGPAAPGQFAHLHLHTSYSLLDGAIRINDLMKQTKALGQTAVAMTDHGNMFGAIEFYKAAVKEGIKPIIGCEFYVAPGDRFIKKTADRIADGGNYHLILLATNRAGYRNMMKLASRSYTEGYYRKPRIDYDLLAQNSEGLVCLTACLAGEVQRKLLQGKDDEASRLAGHLKEVFGPERFFLEIQNHGLPEDQLVTRGNLEIARRQGVQLALTNDAHFLTRGDHAAQDILLRINQKKTMDDELHFGFNPEFYVKSAAEMYALFPEIPEAFHNTARIAEMVDLDFSFGNPLLPRFDVPADHTLDSYLRELALRGLESRYPGQVNDAVRKRFEFEYETIVKMDFSGYFLIVQDFINWAKQNGIPVGPGRGSAAGSIISYALGITDIDPLRYNLLFERFLNPDRNEMPDIDVDFCTERRDLVINYVRAKYGDDHVGQIITYGTMAAKACLKDVARVLNIPFAEANEISKKFPDVLNISIEEAMESSKELRDYADSGDIQKKLFTVAKTLEGNARHTGIHAAGVVISPEPLEEIVPMATVAQKGVDAKDQSRVPVTQYDKDSLESVGLVKMDFLGLRNLTVIDHAVRSIESRTGIRIDLSNLPDDEKTYRLLQKGDVAGVFQLESAGMREFVLKTRPSRFEDIVALIALFRPGPLQAGMADSFINRKNGREKVTYPDPALQDVLQDTYGVIVYQEQVMLISRIIGGFTPGESDALRKAMGKKIHEKMEQMRVKFVEGAVRLGFKEKFAADLYELMAQFASYGFNKSHSAAYAAIVYQTAYLKANYPTDYMRSVLDSEMDRTERLVHYINACRDMNIKILGPDVNESNANFTYIDEGVIRFGLGGVKNVGLQAVDSIIRERDQAGGRYKNFLQVMEHVDLRACNRRALESLIHAGSFDSLGYTRKALVSSIEMAMQHGQRHQADRESGQTSLFGALPETRTTDPIPRGSDVVEFDESEILLSEKEVLGFYFSGHPIARFERILQNIKALPIRELDRLPAGKKIEVAGVLTEISMKPTRTGKEMARFTVEDMSGSMNGVIFPATLVRVRAMLKKDEPLLLVGTLEKREETGTPQLILDGIKELNRDELEKKLERSLHVKLNYSVDTSVIAHLQTILKNYSGGPLTVFFHLPGANAGDETQVIRAHESFSVNLHQDMVERLGRIDQVKGVYLSVGEQVRPLHNAS